jgi:hypothetical protein
MVQTTSIMKTLQIDDGGTKLAQAVAELGCIDKTIQALTLETMKTDTGDHVALPGGTATAYPS